MSARKAKPEQTTPKTSDEMIREIQQVIKDWQLLRGAITPPSRERLLDLLRRSSPADLEASRYLLSPKVHPDHKAWRRIGTLPNDDEAMAKIEAIVGLTPKNGEVQLQNRWERWFSRHLVKFPRDPEQHWLKRSLRSPRP